MESIGLPSRRTRAPRQRPGLLPLLFQRVVVANVVVLLVTIAVVVGLLAPKGLGRFDGHEAGIVLASVVVLAVLNLFLLRRALRRWRG